MDSKATWLNKAWWQAIATGVVTIIVKIAPLVAIYCGTDKAATLTQAGDAISQVILALGALVIAGSAAIETAHYFALPSPPPAPVTPPKVD